MPAPEREISEEFDALNPPVIPAFFKIEKSSGKLSGPITQSGWEGFNLVMSGNGWKVVKDHDFMMTIDRDGYCEIPATPGNKERFQAAVERGEFRRATARRNYDPKRNSLVDAIRPWLRQFVNVPGVGAM